MRVSSSTRRRSFPSRSTPEPQRSLSPTPVTNSGQLVFARGVPVVFSLSQCSVRSVRTSRPLPGGRFDAYPREALSRSTDGAVRRKPISISASIQSLLSLFYASLVVLLETYIKTTFLRAPCIVGTHLSPPFPHWALFNLQSSLLECSFASSASNNLSQTCVFICIA